LAGGVAGPTAIRLLVIRSVHRDVRPTDTPRHLGRLDETASATATAQFEIC